MTPRSNLVDLAGALGVLSREIESDDGIANAVCAEAAQRLLECTKSCLGAWETIETAPLEDGEHVLLDGSGANFDCCSFVGFWCEHRAEWVSFPGAEVVTPTHWMPLPTCPGGEGPALSKPLDAVHCPGCADGLPGQSRQTLNSSTLCQSLQPPGLSLSRCWACCSRAHQTARIDHDRKEHSR